MTALQSLLLMYCKVTADAPLPQSLTDLYLLASGTPDGGFTRLPTQVREDGGGHWLHVHRHCFAQGNHLPRCEVDVCGLCSALISDNSSVAAPLQVSRLTRLHKLHLHALRNESNQYGPLAALGGTLQSLRLENSGSLPDCLPRMLALRTLVRNGVRLPRLGSGCRPGIKACTARRSLALALARLG